MKSIKLLLVDDEEEFLKALSERMRMREVGPEMAFSGEEALDRCREEAPDVMVLDLRMPGIDGVEVLRRTRRDYPQTQIIILTGHGTDKDEQEVLGLGAFAYLQKPVDIDRLLAHIHGAYRKKCGEDGDPV